MADEKIDKKAKLDPQDIQNSSISSQLQQNMSDSIEKENKW